MTKEIKKSLPPEVNATFSRCWDDFLEGCFVNVPTGTYDEDDGNELFREHLDLFLQEMNKPQT